MDTYASCMMSGTFVAAHISLLHSSIVAHISGPYSKVHHVNTYNRVLLWSLPAVRPWVAFRDHSMILWSIEHWGGMSLGFRVKIHGLPLVQRLCEERSLSKGASLPKLCVTYFLACIHVSHLPHQPLHRHHYYHLLHWIHLNRLSA